MQAPAQRLALPAGGRGETAPFCRNQLQATQTAQKRADSHQSGARCVGTLLTIRDLCFKAAIMFLIFVKVLPAVD